MKSIMISLIITAAAALSLWFWIIEPVRSLLESQHHKIEYILKQSR
jgi:HAMP domain-containing protein